jgi:hypothetical protein
MENKRILNRIIFINIANTDYASVEIAGNTCFVGTNNMGKTTLQRAILFFYNANTRWLGISSSQKTFEDYYFQFPNSYIIYEVATEEGFFHVMVYRNTKLFFRFVESPFEQEFYIQNKEAVLPKGVLAALNERGIDYSDQIETFERFRNIVYGADPDKRYKKFALMKGNAHYHNIPLAITSIFLSSESVIKAEFVKECIANAIGSKHTTIELKTIERQLRQFTERYHDIETFFRKENAQRSALIRDNFSSIVHLKSRQRTLAGELGSAVKFAEIQKETIGAQVLERKDLLSKTELDFHEREEQQKEKNKEAHQEIGALKSKLKEGDRKLLEYEESGIVDLLREFESKPQFVVELQAREHEYATLTAGFSDIEQQFKTLFDALENERKEFEHVLSSQGLAIDKKFHEDRNALRDAHRQSESEVKERFHREVDQLRQAINQLDLAIKEAEFKEKETRSRNYYSQEVTLLKNHLEEIRKNKLERASALTVKNHSIESLKKESEQVRERFKAISDQSAEKNRQEVAKLEEQIRHIESKLAVHQKAFFGFLQESYPNWYETIGKVVHEDLLFNQELNPKLLKKGIDSLYGIQLDLTNIGVTSKTLEEYEQERGSLRDQIANLNQAFLNEREEQAREEQSRLASLGKKVAHLKTEVAQLEYDATQDEEREKQYNLDLMEWKRKGDAQREKDLVETYQHQEETKKERATLAQRQDELMGKMKEELAQLEQRTNDQLARLQKTFQKEVENIRSQKENRIEELDDRKAKLQKEKSGILKKKGIDDSRIKKVKKEIDEIRAALLNLEDNAQLINDYKKDKRELFVKLDDFRKEKERLEERIKQSERDFVNERESFAKRKRQLDEEIRELADALKKYTDGLAHFESHFKGKLLYDRLRHLIDPAPAAQTQLDIIGLCSQLQANDNEFHSQFEKFRNNVTEFAGRFRPENHLNFKINTAAGEAEYERFASYLEEFYNENKIQISIAEVAKSHGMLIDAISSKMKALTEYKGRIDKIIGKMEADFSKASFDSSRLIEYVKLKSEDSENKVLRKLQKITEFREQNPFLYGEANLFNTSNKAKGEIDKRSVELLNDLQKTISEEHYEEINVKDLFELRFRIKEGKNDTGWIEKIDKVGSTGTDMLVKAVIYITLLNVFIKESTEKVSRNFSVHCIIDEVGQISAPYLKELINFAEERNICLINGLPNESKLETHYNYTYKFRKDANGHVKVVPLLTMSVEP